MNIVFSTWTTFAGKRIFRSFQFARSREEIVQHLVIPIRPEVFIAQGVLLAPTHRVFVSG
jgi:hypothetical protein